MLTFMVEASCVSVLELFKIFFQCGAKSPASLYGLFGGRFGEGKPYGVLPIGRFSKENVSRDEGNLFFHYAKSCEVMHVFDHGYAPPYEKASFWDLERKA
ncbi:MAG TPA: hypothetical protein DEQ04_02620 [Thermovirga lienii]|nr:hypothetical protein [Thermovirga lienii]